MEQGKDTFLHLRGKIVEVCGTQAAFAMRMGLSSAALSTRLNGSTVWDITEIDKACEILGITIDSNDTLRKFFLCPKCSENGAEEA